MFGKWTLAALMMVGLAVFGCQPPAAESSAREPASSAESESTGEKAPSTAAGTDPKPVAATAPALDPKALPDNLKNDAFRYYGLGNTLPVDFELKVSNRPDVMTGTSQFRLKEVKDGKGIITLERTGGLTVLGSMDLSLEPTGLYVLATTVGKIDKKHLELPAKLTPGSNWTSETKITQDGGQTVEHSSKFRVVRTESVTTKAGKRDALLIQSSGPGKQNGQPVRMDTKMWLVKDRGLVKMEMSFKPAKGEAINMVLQETP